MFRSILLISFLLLTSVPAFAADKYTIDSGHTHVVFSWNHLGFSNPIAQFRKIDGVFIFDATDPTKSSVEVTIPVDSIDTNVPALDEHLKKADYFDATKYPVMTFKSSKVERAGDNKLKVIGDLTVHGTTKAVVLDVTINKIGEYPRMKAPAAGFDATTTLKRSDFGMKTGIPHVSDEIKVSISMEAIEAKAYEAALQAHKAGSK